MQICDFIAAQLQILPVGKRQSCPKMDILRAKSRPLWQAGSRVLPVLYCEQSSRQSTKGLKGWDKANKVGYDLQKTIQRWPNLDFSAFRFPHGDKSSVQGFQFSVLKFFCFQSASFDVSSLLSYKISQFSKRNGFCQNCISLIIRRLSFEKSEIGSWDFAELSPIGLCQLFRLQLSRSSSGYIELNRNLIRKL